jgi:hypothetical protein
MYTSKEIQLAEDIAEALHDQGALSLYLSYTKEVPHDKLRELLAKVCSIPENKIKRSRGALFTYLVSQHKRFGKQW